LRLVSRQLAAARCAALELRHRRTSKASRSLAEYARELNEDIMVVTDGNRPVAAIVLITDESSLHDFNGVDDMELADMHERIRNLYDLDVSDVKSGNLLEIFVRIQEQQADAE
jgi:hypothetical protein